MAKTSIEKIRLYRKRYFKKNPWAKFKSLLASRCGCNIWYLKKGIRNRITTKELKSLWFRDKAYLLKNPSLDRINSNKDYSLDNCRFIELKDNLRQNQYNIKYQQDIDWFGALALCYNNELTDRNWRILRLRFYDKLTYGDLAKRFRVRKQTIHMIVKRALNKLEALKSKTEEIIICEKK